MSNNEQLHACVCFDIGQKGIIWVAPVVQLVDLLLTRRERKFIERDAQSRVPVLRRHDLHYSMLFAIALVKQLNVTHRLRKLLLGGVNFERAGQERCVSVSHWATMSGGAQVLPGEISLKMGGQW